MRPCLETPWRSSLIWTESPTSGSGQVALHFSFLRANFNSDQDLNWRYFRVPDRYKRQANFHRTHSPCYAPGDKVWLSTKDLPLKTDSKKLPPRFIGPFIVLKIINPNAVQLKLPRTLRVHPVFNVSAVKPVASSPLVFVLCGTSPRPDIVLSHTCFLLH